MIFETQEELSAAQSLFTPEEAKVMMTSGTLSPAQLLVSQTLISRGMLVEIPHPLKPGFLKDEYTPLGQFLFNAYQVSLRP